MKWVIGLGTNLGDREANLRGAVRALSEIARVEAVSRVYETEPVPHPRITHRAFAMAPLLDLLPDAKDPRTKKKYANLPGEIVVREDICILQ